VEGRDEMSVARQVTRRLTRRSLILLYHRITAETNDPFSLCVSPKRFEEQLEILHRCSDVITLDELDSHAKRERVAITFDDGYLDNLEQALPVVERLGLPITVFVTSATLGSAKGFWWDRLARLLQGQSEVDVTVALPAGPLRIRVSGQAAVRQALDALQRRLRPLSVDVIDRALDELEGQLEQVPLQSSSARPLTRGELVQLAASPLVTIGAHTTDHRLLGARPAEEQLDTIVRSKADLETLLGREVRHFAYPFGDSASFDHHSVDAVRVAGFRTACTTERGYVTRWSNPLSLPRRMVFDWGGETFAERIAPWSAR